MHVQIEPVRQADLFMVGGIPPAMRGAHGDAMVFPDLLILDEVGIQFGSEAEKLILFDVLNERYEKRKPALLLSNLTAKEVKAFLGERIYDRLREDGGAVIGFAWDSWRKSPVSQANRNE